MKPSRKTLVLYGLAGLAGVAGLGLACIGSVLPLLPLAGVMVIAAGLIWYARYDDQLRRRMLAGEGPHWVIWCREEAVGAIRDADYAALQHRLLHDPRLALATLLRASGVALRQLGTALLCLPTALFWLLLIGVVLRPGLLTGFEQIPAQMWQTLALIWLVPAAGWARSPAASIPPSPGAGL
ncbi:hypothetical protein QR66_08385 [Chromobacterium piscinae]|nr:hypothetical protein QR66_08385 [Chromobacterium piscinae]